MPEKAPRAPRGIAAQKSFSPQHWWFLYQRRMDQNCIQPHYSHNTIYFLIPLDFESALIHTKWSKTQMHSISTPKSLKLQVILPIPAEVPSFAFLKGSYSKANWKYTESTLKYEHGTILSRTFFSTLFRRIYEIFISTHFCKD